VQLTWPLNLAVGLALAHAAITVEKSP
jgi:hypothetical protein